MDNAAALLERRFLLNAFLPVLLFAPAVAAPVMLQHHHLQSYISQWDTQSTTLKVLEFGAYLTLVWFVAAIVASQWRSITQLFEGYHLMRLWRPLARAAIAWHEKRRDTLTKADERVQAYPEHSEDLLPTRLGNILRSAERYPWYRYNADSIIVWPRLYRILPADFVANVEFARARMEFLLVISLWFACFAVISSGLLIASSSPEIVVVACFVTGMVLSYLTYVASLRAATEYGDRIRASFDLHRLELLPQLKLKAPANLQQEQDLWSYVYHSAIHGRTLPAAWLDEWTYKDPPPAEATLNIRLRRALRGR